jgi:2-oxoisovalerate dehydrogenase E1 component
MPKSVNIDPNEVRATSTLDIPSIPINAYASAPAAESAKYGKETLNGIHYDMSLIREFETMLDTIKKMEEYQGIPYTHGGPAHLSIGQESLVVGQSLHLNIEDFLFGSHRSHGEILAKCMSAIAKADDAWLQNMMETYMDGTILRKIEKDFSGGTVKELAEGFVLYGTLAEVFGREPGFNKGMGGSMHAFFAPLGSMPNNAIVGGSADIATGAALYKRCNRQPGIVIANIGDASSACGPTWEAMMFAAMDQYQTLWPEDIGGAPPILFNFINNFYGMGGQTYGETMGFGILARIGAGVNPDAMHAERVDGYNPLAVADAIERKRAILEAGKGPVLLDTITYRISGHSPSDASSYRSQEEVDMWLEHDCVANFGKYLTDNSHAAESELEERKASILEKLRKTCALATCTETSPRLNVGMHLGDMMFSDTPQEKMDDREPEVLLAYEDNPRIKKNKRKSRSGIGPDGKALPKARCIALRDALFEAMIHRFYTDPTMVAFGEENRDWGGAFAVYNGLTEALPYHRLFNSPISEASITGAGVGYALAGGRCVAELMYCDFMGRAGDEIFNQMAKWQSMSANVLNMPLVLRVSVGSKYGAQHSQDWTSIVSHIPGLKVMFPVTPYDAKGMLNLALNGTDPVIFFESQRIYDIPETFVEGGVPEGYYEVPEGEPAIRREGSDITIVTIGATMFRALDAADELQEKYGVSAEVIDARFINPLNYDTIIESAKKTGRVLLSSDACDRGSFLHNMASVIGQAAFDQLDGPVTVLGARNWITPPFEMEPDFFPQKEWMIDAINEQILPLEGHTPTTVQTTGEVLRRHRLGV